MFSGNRLVQTTYPSFRVVAVLLLELHSDSRACTICGLDHRRSETAGAQEARKAIATSRMTKTRIGRRNQTTSHQLDPVESSPEGCREPGGESPIAPPGSYIYNAFEYLV
ncbi:hypothetical protein BN903_14 [Halorubrum sp. AJ67]|nr:hypothetical protein BN903_14 [Halorubrum sp. AJ67]